MRSNDWSYARSMPSTTCSRSGCLPKRQPMTSANGRLGMECLGFTLQHPACYFLVERMRLLHFTALILSADFKTFLMFLQVLCRVFNWLTLLNQCLMEAFCKHVINYYGHSEDRVNPLYPYEIFTVRRGSSRVKPPDTSGFLPSTLSVVPSLSLQAGSAVCGEPPPLGVGDGKLRRQRHHGGAPEQRPGCGVVGQTQVSASCVCSKPQDLNHVTFVVILLNCTQADQSLACVIM